MAIASLSPPSFFASSFSYTQTETTRFSFSYYPSIVKTRSHQNRARFSSLGLSVSSRFNSSRSSGAGGSVSPDNGDLQSEVQHGFSPHRRNGSPVFVTLPIDVVSSSGQVRRKKAMMQSFRALSLAGVEGLVMEVWWGIVEKDKPRVYDWGGYLEIASLARICGLKIRAAIGFHQCGTGPGDSYWIPLPQWVIEEINKDPDLAYSDRFGTRNMEYISIGCDTLPVLRGRSPIQVYSDFMRNFRDAFKPLLGSIITGIQVGMGPAGELRYPSRSTSKLTWDWRSRELEEFQCYDMYMLASLNASARETGVHEWGNGDDPIGASNLIQNLEQTDFFKINDGSWNTTYRKFFLKWYSSLLLYHGERICREAETIFRGTEVATSAKVARIQLHYATQSKDGYLAIARMFGRYGFTLCCSGLETQDMDEKQMNNPEGFLKQILSAASICEVPLQGENYTDTLDDRSFQQVIKISKLYSDGLYKPSFSFNFVRVDKNLFDYRNWVRFTRFVRQISHGNMFRAKLDFTRDKCMFSSVNAAKNGSAFAYR